MIPSLGYTDVFPKREMWEKIAKEMNGEFHVKLTAGNTYEIHHITIPYKKWKIEISSSDAKPLRFSILFNTHQEFDLMISWEDWMEKIRKKLGGQDVETGSKEFDKHYLIKSCKPHLVKEIITKEIRDCFLKYDVYSLSFQPEPEKATAELMSVIQKTPGNKEMALELISAFKTLVDNLEVARVIR
jgi:hypothetical protein